MNNFDASPVAFSPKSLNFRHQYSEAILVFDDLTWAGIQSGSLVSTAPVYSTSGKLYRNFREYNYGGGNILLVDPGVGAPAAVMDFELLIASGITKFVGFGTCGVFDPAIPQNSLIIPTGAIRDEGTSYHYFAPSVPAVFSDYNIHLMQTTVSDLGIPSYSGLVWTTDAVYRETADKIKAMREHGCIAVDMELSALMIVAQFRGVDFMQFLIVHDLVPPQNTRLTPPLEHPAMTYLNLALRLV